MVRQVVGRFRQAMQLEFTSATENASGEGVPRRIPDWPWVGALQCLQALGRVGLAE